MEICEHEPLHAYNIDNSIQLRRDSESMEINGDMGER
jgi:hypothetical protein